MVKSSNKTKRKTKAKVAVPLWKKNLRLTALFVLAFVAAVYFGTWKIQNNRAIAKERAAYETADHSMQQLYDKIVGVFGQPVAQLS